MSQHLHVFLSEEERTTLESLLRRGSARARVQTRARILLLADRSQGVRRTREQVAEQALCCTLTVGQVCRRYVTGGLEVALSEKRRPGPAPKITVQVEAQLVALSRSDPPEGYNHWTPRLLAAKLVEMELVESISEVAVYKRLKRQTEALSFLGAATAPPDGAAGIRSLADS